MNRDETISDGRVADDESYEHECQVQSPEILSLSSTIFVMSFFYLHHFALDN